MTKIFVSDFGSHMTVADIAELFQEYGHVEAVKLRQGQKRSYAIVDMPNDSDAAEAIRKLDRKEWKGQRLEVKESTW